MDDNIKSSSKRKVWLIVAALAFAGFVICVLLCLRYCTPPDLSGVTIPDASDTAVTAAVTSGTDESGAVEETVVCPIDFAALQSDNPDIYAWIRIPGTKINYPIVQRDDNNEYYLRRDCYGNSYIGGCIFTENYNAKDFTDPNTLIYGHSGMADGSMFTQLQELSSIENFDNIRQIFIYTSERMYTYEIFAAYPFTDHHVLLNYDFTTEEGFNTFFDEVYASTDMRAVFSDDYRPQFGEDRLVTLSTCLDGNNERRYLVQGHLTSDIKAVPADTGDAG